MTAMRAALLLAAVVAVVAAADHRDSYLEEARAACGLKEALACAKLRALSYLDGVAGGQVGIYTNFK